MLPITKELPKEMLPLFSSDGDQIALKPLLQILFEQLYGEGFREFCFVVGRGKRSIEDHFTPDFEYIEYLRRKDKTSTASSLERFYDKIDKSYVVWINQPKPKGFGHAVLLSEVFVGDDDFLVHAGDTQIISSQTSHIDKLKDCHKKYKADATLSIRRLSNPKGHGIVIPEKIQGTISVVKDAIEKPKNPPSNFGIMPLYIFNNEIFRTLKRTGEGYGKEIQLTDGIRGLIRTGRKVMSVELDARDFRLDVGDPDYYFEAINLSYNNAKSFLKRS